MTFHGNRTDEAGMENSSLTALTFQHLELAREASSGRSAYTVYGDRERLLCQTLIALASGEALEAMEDSSVLLTVAMRR